MLCTNCGANIEDGKRFCDVCGASAPMDFSSNPVPTTPQPPVAPTPIAPTPQPKPMATPVQKPIAPAPQPVAQPKPQVMPTSVTQSPSPVASTQVSVQRPVAPTPIPQSPVAPAQSNPQQMPQHMGASTPIYPKPVATPAQNPVAPTSQTRPQAATVPAPQPQPMATPAQPPVAPAPIYPNPTPAPQFNQSTNPYSTPTPTYPKPGQNPYDMYGPTNPNSQQAIPVPNKYSKPKRANIGAIIASVVIIIGALFAVLFFTGSLDSILNINSPKAVTQKFLQSMFEGEAEEAFAKYSEYDMEKFYKAIDDEIAKHGSYGGIYGSADFRSLLNQMGNSLKATAKSRFGDNYKVSVKIISTRNLSKSEMELQIDEMNKNLGISENDPNDEIKKIIPTDKITDMCQIEAKIIFSGNGRKGSSNMGLYCVKINGKWKVAASLLKSLN